MRPATIFLLILAAILPIIAASDNTNKTFRLPLRKTHAPSQFDRRLISLFPLKMSGIFLTAHIGIGTPPQFFDLVISTAYSDIVVADGLCNNCGQPSKIPLYSGRLSSTFKDLEQNYIYGQELRGGWTADIFNLLAKPVTRPFARAFQVPQDWVDRAKFSGWLGLGLHRSPPYQTLPEYFSKTPLLDKNIFSCRFLKNNPDTGGDIVFGAMEQQYVDGDIQYTNVIADIVKPLWTIPIEDLQIGHRSVASGTVYIDSATNYLGFEKSVVEELYDGTGAKRMDDGYWAVPDQFPYDVSFIIGERMFTVPKGDIPLRQFKKYGDLFLGAIQETTNSWYIGIPFMENFYVVFDFSSGFEKIGIGKRKG